VCVSAMVSSRTARGASPRSGLAEQAGHDEVPGGVDRRCSTYSTTVLQLAERPRVARAPVPAPPPRATDPAGSPHETPRRPRLQRRHDLLRRGGISGNVTRGGVSAHATVDTVVARLLREPAARARCARGTGRWCCTCHGGARTDRTGTTYAERSTDEAGNRTKRLGVGRRGSGAWSRLSCFRTALESTSQYRPLPIPVAARYEGAGYPSSPR
jgi:hypothetical protein